MSSGPAHPEEQLLELLLHLKRTTPDSARTILNSQPQISYALITLMVTLGAVNVDVLQKTVASFGATQAAVSPSIPPPPPLLAPPPPQYRTSTPQGPIPLPSSHSTNGHHPPPSTNHYTGSIPIQNPPIPDAIASMPDDQKAMIMRVIAMTPDEINRLPPADRAGILQLRATLGL